MYIANPKILFNPFVDRKWIKVANPLSYSFRTAKREGYEVRMQYATKDCFAHNGKVFNTTLTYCDKALHQYCGFNVPDAHDLRWLMHDSTFRNRLRDEYGVGKFEYFIGTELGEGKGQRGYHNNPHYHIIWFVYPVEGKTYFTNHFNGMKFLQLVKEYWQGHFYKVGKQCFSTFQEMQAAVSNDVVVNGKYKVCLYKGKDCRFGIVRCGKYGVENNSNFGMNTYVCKYACKDIDTVHREAEVYYQLLEKWTRIFELLGDDIRYAQYQDYLNLCEDNMKKLIKSSEHLTTPEDMARAELRYFRTHHSTRVRVTHGLGESAKYAIDDLMKPRVPYQTSKGIQYRQLPQYIFRKIYRTVNPETFTYEKNTLGIKLDKFQKQYKYEHLIDKAIHDYTYFQQLDMDKYAPYFSNRYDVFAEDIDNSWMQIFDNELNNIDLNTIKNEKWTNNLFTRYAFYKTYCEGLCFNPLIRGYSSDAIADSSYDDDEQTYQKYHPFESHEIRLDYSQHPEFADDLYYFGILDDILEVKSSILDRIKQKEKSEQEQLKRKHGDSTYDNSEFDDFVGYESWFNNNDKMKNVA